MATFPLKIVTPDGLQFDGDAQLLSVRTTSGEVGILANHIDFVSPLGMGMASIVAADGTRRNAACIGGMVSVIGGKVSLVPTTFEWADSIDLERAKTAKENAEATLRTLKTRDEEYRRAESKIRRALVRINVANFKG